MPALFTNQDAAIAELHTKLAKVTAERDRARDIAVALEQESVRCEYERGFTDGAAKVTAAVEAAFAEMLTWCGPYGYQGVAHFIDRRDEHIRAAIARGGAA